MRNRAAGLLDREALQKSSHLADWRSSLKKSRTGEELSIMVYCKENSCITTRVLVDSSSESRNKHWLKKESIGTKVLYSCAWALVWIGMDKSAQQQHSRESATQKKKRRVADKSPRWWMAVIEKNLQRAMWLTNLGEKSDVPDNNAHKKRKKETAMWQTKSVLARIRKEQEKERERGKKKEKKKRLVREAQTSSADAAYQDPKRIREGEKTKTTTRQKQNRKKRRLVIEAQNQKKFRKRKIQQRKGTEESRLRTPPRQSQKSQQQQLDIARILRRKDRKKGEKNNEKARERMKLTHQDP